MRGRRSRSRRLTILLALAGVVGLGAPAVPAPAVLAQAIWVAPGAERIRKNPLPADPATLALGERVAKTNCAPCHGTGFTGNGPAAAALTPRPADWTSERVQGETDGALFWKISTGRGSMPPWKHLPEKERWAIVHFLRSLRK